MNATKNMQPARQVRVVCDVCFKVHEMTTFGEQLVDTTCIPCIDQMHAEFMRTTGRRLGMTCTCPACAHREA